MTSSVQEETKMAEFKEDTPNLVPSNYGCEILIENGTWAQVSEKNFPNDARIVTYIVDGKKCYDLTSGRKIVNIFDMYWDKYKHDLKSIDFGYGNINPKLWGNKPKKDKKRK